MITNQKLEFLIEEEMVASFLLEFPMKWTMCDGGLLLFSQNHFITIYDLLMEDYLAIDIFEVSSRVTISSSILVDICFERGLLKQAHLIKTETIKDQRSSLYLSYGQKKQVDLYAGFVALRLLFGKITNSGIKSLGKTSDTLVGYEGPWRNFELSFKLKQLAYFKSL